jgi:lysophospholipase L1-like esterase
MKTLVCIGDSIVEGEGDTACRDGWVGRIRERLAYNAGRDAEGWQVYNLGIGGNTILDVKHRLGEVLVRNPDMILLGCGGNDIKRYLLPDGTYERALSDKQVKRNWEESLNKLSRMAPKFAVLGGHNHTAPKADETVIIRHKDNAEHMAYVKDLCESKGITFIEPVHYAKTEGVFSHGSHPNAAGYDMYADHIYSKLQQLNWI